MNHIHRVLAVDDNPLNLEIMAEILGDSFSLQYATGGAEAIAIAKEFEPTVVLLDVMMPGMDGLETCRRIRSIPNLRDCQIIIVSAKAMESEREAGLAAGADQYVTKPFDEDALLELVTSSARAGANRRSSGNGYVCSPH